MKLEKDPAPALTKGIFVLDTLVGLGEGTLDKITSLVNCPKSSVFRYLQALEALGIVEFDDSRRVWIARKKISAIESTEGDLLNEVGSFLLPLANEVGFCAELYAVKEGTIVMINRAEPEHAGVSINAKIGYIREHKELDATVKIYYAFGKDSTEGKQFTHAVKGEQKEVKRSDISRILDQVRSDQFSVDNDFNANGVRRFAIPVLRDGELLAIMAIAQHLTPQADVVKDSVHNSLQKYISIINKKNQ
jgi:DNA-binding IclR family transcriptional regulator